MQVAPGAELAAASSLVLAAKERRRRPRIAGAALAGHRGRLCCVQAPMHRLCRPGPGAEGASRPSVRSRRRSFAGYLAGPLAGSPAVIDLSNYSAGTENSPRHCGLSLRRCRPLRGGAGVAFSREHWAASVLGSVDTRSSPEASSPIRRTDMVKFL